MKGQRVGSGFKEAGNTAGGMKRRDNEGMDANCRICKGAGWVCEDHLDKPWSGASDDPKACRCGGAGAPCPACNPGDGEHRPELPDGYESFIRVPE